MAARVATKTEARALAGSATTAGAAAEGVTAAELEEKYHRRAVLRQWACSC